MNKVIIQRLILDFLYFSGASRLLAGKNRGIGSIFMLHHIRPGGGLQKGFAPNSALEITPEFLDKTISFVKKRGYDLISIDEASRRIKAGNHSKKPFAVFTIDDGYRDNFEHAWPVFKKHDCPFTIFASTAIIDGTCDMWWKGLEAVIAQQSNVSAQINGEIIHLETGNATQKKEAFARLYWPVRSLEEHAQRQWVSDFCDKNGIDLKQICRDEAMNWDELREINADPLCTIGAHTINHFAIKKLDADEARFEAVESRRLIAEELGTEPTSFAYPYGDVTSSGKRDYEIIADAGFDIAVTTRKGTIHESHAETLTALPRVSLNGGFQSLRYVDVLMSGTAFSLYKLYRLLSRSLKSVKPVNLDLKSNNVRS